MTAPIDSWRQALDAKPILADPHVQQTSTLIAVADKLDAVRKMLGTLNDDHPKEREDGLAVANMAVTFGLAVLDHFGLVDDDGPIPPIIKLKMAQCAITNLLAEVRSYIEAWNAAANEHNHDPQCEIASSSGGLVIDRGTFSINYKGKSRQLGNTLAFRLLERLAQSPGVYLSISTLIQDVWKGKEVSDEAVQRQASTLGIALKEAGIKGIVIESQPGHYRLLLA